MSRLRAAQRGFTMVEAMVAASMFVFGFMATNKAQVNMLKSVQESIQQGEASKIATTKTEQLMAYSSIANYNNITSSSYNVSGTDSSFANTVTVATQSKYKQITQTVSWTNSNGQSNTFSITNYISSNDPKMSGLLLSSSTNSTPIPLPGSNVTSNNLASYTSLTSSGVSSTTTATIPGTSNVITYDQNLNPTTINGVNAVTISGTIFLATGTSAPSNSLVFSNITITPQTTNSIVASCSYQKATGVINCIMGNSWSGSVLVGGISGVKVCTVYQQPYSNVIQSFVGRDYLLINTSSTCPSSYPYLLQTL